MKCKKKSLQFDSFLPLSFSFCSYLILYWKCHDPSSNICLYLQCTCVCICSPLLQITPSSKMQTVSDFYFEEEEEAYLGCKFLRVCVHLAEVKRQASFSVICPTAGPWILNSSLESLSRCLSVTTWRDTELCYFVSHPSIHPDHMGGRVLQKISPPLSFEEHFSLPHSLMRQVWQSTVRGSPCLIHIWCNVTLVRKKKKSTLK